MTRRETLIAKIKQQLNQKEFGALGPIVSLEDFFVGNEDLGSIGCNLMKHPGIDQFYQILKKIRDKAEVYDILVEIYEFDETDEIVWPFSERIHILTSGSQEMVKEWVLPLMPDEVYETPESEGVFLRQQTRSDLKVYSVWWD